MARHPTHVRPEEQALMASTLFYERPVALDRERHRATRLSPAENHYAFAANTNALPVATTEFAEAARHYPIVFVGEKDGPFGVAVLVGMANHANLMVDEQGQWAANTYIPAFARRYPFVLAQGDGKEERLTVCIDEVYPGLSTERGEALFDEQGRETPYLQRVLEFLSAFHQDVQRTNAFAQRLKELGLLQPKTITVDRAGNKQTLEGVWIVDEPRLRGLDDARVVELFRAGYLPWIEAHLLSLGNLQQLAARMDQRQAGAAAARAAAAEAAEPRA